MMRKLVFLLVSVALFNTTAVMATWNTRWVAGLSGGVIASKGELNTTLVYAGLPFTVFPYDTTDIEEHSQKAWEAGGLIGYEAQCHGWILGLEASVDWYDASRFEFAFADPLYFLFWSGQSRLSTAPVLGVTGRFAYVITPYFIPFMRAGIEVNHNKLEVSYSSDQNVFPGIYTVDANRWELSYLVGFGLEVPLLIKTCPSIRIEYNYHSFFHAGGFEDKQVFSAFPIDPVFTVNTHPISHSWKLSLVWQIG